MTKYAVIEAFHGSEDNGISMFCVKSFDSRKDAENHLEVLEAEVATSIKARNDYFEHYVQAVPVPAHLAVGEWLQHVKDCGLASCLGVVTPETFRKELRWKLLCQGAKLSEKFKDFSPPPTVPYRNLAVVEIP